MAEGQQEGERRHGHGSADAVGRDRQEDPGPRARRDVHVVVAHAEPGHDLQATRALRPRDRPVRDPGREHEQPVEVAGMLGPDLAVGVGKEVPCDPGFPQTVEADVAEPDGPVASEKVARDADAEHS